MKMKREIKEALAVAAVILGMIGLQWSLWVSGRRMLSHDSITWLGVFSYFYDCLRQGILPLWNPYMNSGEIFFLNVSLLHLWDPSTLALILAGKIFRIHTLTVYQYDLLLRYLIFISGSYIFFRRIAKYRFSAFFAFLTLSFSALCSSYLKQHGFILCFYTFPWILFFTFKFIEERQYISLLWLALLLGSAFSTSGYHIMYLISSCFILIVSILLSGGFVIAKGPSFVNNRKTLFLAAVIFLLLSVNLIPNFLAYIRDTVPDVRFFEATKAAIAYPADFFNLFAPYSFMLHFEMLYFKSIRASEGFLYIGLIPLFLAITGLFYSGHRYKKGFILAAAVTALLMLGPAFGVSKLFSYFFPFFFIIRNTHTFSTFLIFCLAYFVCTGTDFVLERINKQAAEAGLPKGFIAAAIFIFGAAVLINLYILAVFRPPLAQLPGRYAALTSALGQDFATVLHGIFLRSYYNAILFIVSISAVFYLLKKHRMNLKFKCSILILLTLVDLVLFNTALYKFTTIPKADLALWPKSKCPFSEERAPVMLPRYPFLGFAPAMQRIFCASNPRIPGITTHFYEMKDYFIFENNKLFPSEIKEIFAGITGRRLKLVSGVVVLPPKDQSRACAGLSEGAAHRVVFIEEEPPAGFSKLKIPPEKITESRIVPGTINVRGFDPNSILLEVSAAEPCVLYYSDGFDRSWRVFIDGMEGRVYRANMAFKSVFLEQGRHAVRFVYDPRLYKITLFCYFAGLFLAAIVLLWNIYTRRGR